MRPHHVIVAIALAMLAAGLFGAFGGGSEPDYCGGCPTGSACQRGVSTKIGVAVYECVEVKKRVEVGINAVGETAGDLQ